MPASKLKTKKLTALRALCGAGIHGDWKGDHMVITPFFSQDNRPSRDQESPNHRVLGGGPPFANSVPRTALNAPETCLGLVQGLGQAKLMRLRLEPESRSLLSTPLREKRCGVPRMALFPVPRAQVSS